MTPLQRKANSSSPIYTNVTEGGGGNFLPDPKCRVGLTLSGGEEGLCPSRSTGTAQSKSPT